MLDGRGNSDVSMEHRQQKANANYFKNRTLLRAKGPLEARFRAWGASAATSATYAAETWHITPNLLHKATSWKMVCLRDMFDLKRRPDDDRPIFQQASFRKPRSYAKVCARPANDVQHFVTAPTQTTAI